MKKTTTYLLFIGAFFVGHVPDGNGQAYCSLRDPESSVEKMFGGGNRLKSMVRTIDAKGRETCSKIIGMDFHRNELGRHTLYRVTGAEGPLGFVHVRAERGRWGLDEFVWAFDNQLRVRDFTIQRCRDFSRREIESSSFRNQLVGKSLTELIGLLNDDRTGLANGKVSVSKKAESLATQAIRSGIKALALTQVVWLDGE